MYWLQMDFWTVYSLHHAFATWQFHPYPYKGVGKVASCSTGLLTWLNFFLCLDLKYSLYCKNKSIVNLYCKFVNLIFAAVLGQTKWNWYLLVNNLVDFSVLSFRDFLLKTRFTFSYFGLVFIFQPKMSKDIRMDAYPSYMKCNIWGL